MDMNELITKAGCGDVNFDSRGCALLIALSQGDVTRFESPGATLVIGAGYPQSEPALPFTEEI